MVQHGTSGSQPSHTPESHSSDSQNLGNQSNPSTPSNPHGNQQPQPPPQQQQGSVAMASVTLGNLSAQSNNVSQGLKPLSGGALQHGLLGHQSLGLMHHSSATSLAPGNATFSHVSTHKPMPLQHKLLGHQSLGLMHHSSATSLAPAMNLEIYSTSYILSYF